MIDNEIKSTPYIDECKMLILKTLEQAIRDFIALEDATTPSKKFLYETATEFIFNDEYRVDWGNEPMLVSDLLDQVNINKEWFRTKVYKIKEKKISKKEKLSMVKDLF